MKKNILVMDIGNTNVVCGLYMGINLLGTWRFCSDKNKTADEYFVLLNTLFGTLLKTSKPINESVDFISISSVVPLISNSIEMMINKYFRKPYVFVKSDLDLGLNFIVDDPRSVGADLIVNAYVCLLKHKTNCIIIDFGTATTIQLIGADGVFYGVAILPGLITSANSLFDKAALLSQRMLENPSCLIGKNTHESLMSGIIKGHCFAIEGFIKRIRAEYKNLKDIKTIATGGLSHFIIEQTDLIDEMDKNLTLEGLFYVACKILEASSQEGNEKGR